ncbi:hypothetical protein DFH08DRAFT_705532 [Mycena albidolilacea]|uniref:NADAR domain-containing protein n=1 Tax=Mycena albidolilacea TaxID=1033008 RepID=A0AAD7EN32_9AGAR|nr:hypothetical protein DFH08DRAFT_705532 [Mycena albidolilacea]
MVSVGQPPAPAPLTPIRFSGFTPEFIPFLNYSPHRVIYQNAVYPTAMHLHEAMKFLPNSPAFAERIRACADVGRVHVLSKKLTRQSPNAVRSDWVSVYLLMMEEAIILKFRQHANLQEMLLSTGDAPLIYADAEDTYWGEGPDHNGMNNLGLLLQRIRTQLRSESRLTS